MQSGSVRTSTEADDGIRGHATVELSLLSNILHSKDPYKRKSFKEVNQSVLKLESVCIIRSSRRHVNQVTGAFGGVKVVWSLPHVKEVTGSSYVV
ncbi:hypothetical protein Bca52824_094761 [Brassica carinata]|uniref:Uncharacterized protein n=1 Tax=Brassica carinata TaxID=52824 RepID=A0A8X7P1K3_BRACI|nr:hypothetical protein Bca52824_094761 [Brassica carinata]